MADMQAEPHRARPDLDARSGVRAYVAAPLIWEGLALGVVTVAATVPGALGPREAALVQELAEHAAAAVAHARAFAREQDQRAETEALNRELAKQTHHLEQMQRQLIQTEKLTAMGQLAHGIAHELNTPLGVIVSNLAVLSEYGTSLAEFSRAATEAVAHLEQHEAPSSVADALQMAAQSADLGYILVDLPQLISESTASAERIAMLVRSVATFASQGSDKLAAVSVEEALEAAITLAWNELKQRAQVVRNFAGMPPALGQLSELTQVFVHLLLNAAHSLEDRPGTITVTTALDGNDVLVALSDDGCGIAPEHLARVFDPFFSTREPGMGTGMGLAVCHGIVARFGGTIGVESGLGRGTTVTVRLRLAELALEEAA